MGSGSAIGQYKRRFHQEGTIYERRLAPEERCKEQTIETLKSFGEYEIRVTKEGEYEPLRSGESIGRFSSIFIKEDRVLFPLSHGMALEISEIGCRTIFTPEKAELCGLIASDGGLYSTREHPIHQVSFTSKDREIVDHYKELFKEVYNIEPHVYYSERKNGRAYFEVKVYDRNVYFDLLNFDIKPAAFRFHVPLKYLDKEGLRAYLRGFFSGDGEVSKNGKRYRIRIKSSDREGIEELREAFKLLGFHPLPIHPHKQDFWYDSYYFEIPKEECIRFAKEIGTCHPRRTRRLESIKLKYKTEEEEEE